MAAAAMADARRRGRPLAMVVADIDFMKTVNDRRGHDCGDRALVIFSDCVQACIREEDLFGRLGGDEFCILLIDVDERRAAEIVERARRELEDMEVAPGLNMTASFGVAGFRGDDVAFGQVLIRADAALRAAKRRGRNRTAIYEDEAIAA